ncbi:MAG TPA: YafY family protein [Marmoricola sp.]
MTRLLALVPYLQKRQDRPLREIAADFGLEPEQLRRDLQVLWMCGLPGLGPGDLIDLNFESFEDDPDGQVRIGNAEYLTRPLRLGSTEAAALTVALRTLRDSGGEAPRDVIDRVLDKIERAAADAGPAPVGAEERAVPDEIVGVRRALEAAISADRQVSITYFVPSRDEASARTVDPLAVFGHDGHTYLDAWCHLAQGRRTFRLDRIDAVTTLEATRARSDEPPLDLSDGLFSAGPDDVEVRLAVAPRARWVADYYPVTAVAESADGGLEVTLAASDERWLIRLVLGLAPHVRILAPASLATAVSDRARAALAHYER